MDSHSLPIRATEAMPPTSGSSIGAWIEKIGNKMEAVRYFRKRGKRRMWNSASIFRIPASSRRQSPEHYLPKVVAIGPYHRGNSNLKINDEEKWCCVDRVISERSLNLERWLHDMTSWEEEARNYYSEDVPMDSESFIEMLLLDGCFLLAALGACWGEELMEWAMDQIIRDVLLLENQIPYFVLVYLLYGTRTPDFPNLLYRESLVTFNLCYRVRLQNFNDANLGQIHHLLHLFRLLLDPNKQSKRSEYMEPSQIPTNISSAIELKDQSAVKIQKNNGAESFLDITFNNGVIEIPPMLEISDNTNALLLNLIVFEECKSDILPCVTNYVAFLDSLMKKESDVELLERSGILLNKLPSKRDVLDFFNNSSPKARFYSSSSYLAMIFQNVSKYHNKRWHKWYADLKLNYFSNPWVTLSVGAAAILLILSFLQTYYSILVIIISNGFSLSSTLGCLVVISFISQGEDHQHVLVTRALAM